MPTEITSARVCREVGATVRRNVKLRDVNVHVDASDDREVEVLAAGLPIGLGAQLAFHITLRSVLTCCGAPRPNAAAVDGAVLTLVTRKPDIPNASQQSGVVSWLSHSKREDGGAAEALSFVEEMAQVRARNAPFRLCRSTFLAWRKRWTRMLSVSCTSSPLPWDAMSGFDGATPDLADLFGSV